jgi:glycosyltransferase involved in cell wall biosynthesis
MSTPWHIVHAVRSDAFAGTERYVTMVAAEQNSRGHAVTVVGGDPTAMRAQLPDDVRVIPAATTMRVAAALRNLRDAAVVHTHLTAAEMATVVVQARRTTAVVTTRHIAGRRGSRTMVQPVIRVLARRIDAQIAISQFVAERIEGSAIVLHNPTMRETQSLLSSRTVLMAQRLEREKDVATGIRAFGASGLADQGWTLLIAGVGSQRSHLLADVTRHDLGGSVRFLGHVSDMAELRRSSSMFLTAALEEPFGLSVVEAMAAGIPVVATATGGHLETIGLADDRLLYAPGDVLAAAHILRHLATDERHRIQVGAALRSYHGSHFTIDRHVDTLHEVYAAAVAARRREAP